MDFSIKLSGFLVVLLILGIVLVICRRRYAYKKVCSMNTIEKSELLESLISPLGYFYLPKQDVISSRNNAWQRAFGYTALFDYAAPHFHMVFDWLPIYFYYQNRTWLIELWKGQYGINTGAEVGIYYCDKILSEEERSTELFKAVEDNSALPVSFHLRKNDELLASVSKRTWWLTAFCMGRFSKPEDLLMEVSIIFPNHEMLGSFLLGLRECNFPVADIDLYHLQLTLYYSRLPANTLGWYQTVYRSVAQQSNKFFCKLYLFITRRFSTTIDRLLFLYYLLPICFRHTLRLHRYSKHIYQKKQKECEEMPA